MSLDSPAPPAPDSPLLSVIFRPGEVVLIFQNGHVLFLSPEWTVTSGKDHR